MKAVDAWKRKCTWNLRKHTILFYLLSLVVIFGATTAAAVAADQEGGTVSLVIKLVGGLSPSEQSAVITRHGGVEKSSIPALRLHVVEVPADNLPLVLEDYQADPQVESVELNRTRKAEAVPADPDYGVQWALFKIGWESVFGTLAPTGSATVALLDTGVDASHPDLAGNILPGTSILDGSNGQSDPSGHGTWLAGIVAAVTDNGQGIAGVGYAGVRITPVTVLNAGGIGQDGDIIAGILWAADHGADVILMGFSNPDFSQNLQDAIDYAWNRGAVLVAATGNGGLATPTFPAGDRGVIGVSATDQDDALALGSNFGQDVFLGAPGADIFTTAPGESYATISGTSASSAIVAGVAAIMKAADPSLANGIIVGRLARSADPAGTREETGNGRVNMERALADTGTEAIQPSGAAPVGSGGPFVGPYVAAAPKDKTTTTNLSSSLNPSVFGKTVTFTAIVSNSASTPTGSVAFKDGAATLGTVTLSSGQASYSSATLSVGSHSITAQYTPDNNGNFNSGTSSPLIQDVQPIPKADQAITFETLGDKTYGDAPFTVSATASSGLPVSFTSAGNCSVAESTVSLTGAGSCTITAHQAGDADYNAAPDVSRSFAIAQATPTITWANPADITYGTALSGIQLNATASVPGSYAYTPASGTVLSAGSAQALAVTFTPDDANYATATAGALINVAKASLIVTAEAQSKVYGTADPSLTYTHSGLVNGDTAALFSGALNRVQGENVGTYVIGQGTLSAGDNYQIAFTGASLTITPTTATVSLGSLSHTYDGTAKSASFTTTPAGLSIALTYNDSETAPTNAGSYAVVATVTDPNYQGSAGGTLTIAAAAQTITFGELVDRSFGSAPFTVSAVATSDLPVSFTAAGTCSVSGSTVTLTGTGSCTITASQAGNSNFDAAPAVSRSFSVLEAVAGSYTITASAGAGGGISPAGSVAVTEGLYKTFYISPASGYKVANVIVDGVSLGARTSYTFTEVSAPHTISASFEPQL